MNKEKINITILPNLFLNADGTFNKKEALKLAGKIAGLCYDKEGFIHLQNEPVDKTLRRIDRTLNNGHHSVYDHITINFNIQNLPKILAMVLNNEHQYTTIERSARYIPIIRQNNSITEIEEKLYNKWVKLFETKIKIKYKDIFKESKIEKLAQENARYLVTVFMPTQMIYSTSLRQINYIASWMEKYIKDNNAIDYFELQLQNSMKEFLKELQRLNVLEEKLMNNEKDRTLSLFGKNLNNNEEYFGNVYSTVYKGSFAQLAQAHRHRTLDYQMERLKQKEYFIPPIINDDNILINEWLNDMQLVKDYIPQGELIKISEIGKYEDFILKCKERLCTEAQLEIMEQTKITLLNYKKALENANHPLKDDIQKYSHGARCTFPNFNCPSNCQFKEGKILTRKI